MSNFKCVLFDCDGVLVDTETTSFRVFGEVLSSLGYEAPIAKMAVDFSGTSLGACMRHVEGLFNMKLPENFEAIFREKSFEAFKKEVTPIPNIHELLEDFPLPFCTASSAQKAKIILNLTTAKLIHHFEGKIYSAYEIQQWKPDPGVFLWAAKEMGFTPDECLVVEDSFSGLTAARAGGFKAIGYAPKEHNVKLLTPMNVPLISDIREVKNYL
jgi:HAD superfamily hydrolase (TIGR01509 family)